MSEPKTEKIKTGGPAFPEGEAWTSTDVMGHQRDCSRGPLRAGMTMRQWYAGMAMQGMLACSDTPAGWSETQMAEFAFRYADAMVEQQWRPTDQSQAGTAGGAQ